jgi:large subunit ribosomal protein L4
MAPKASLLDAKGGKKDVALDAAIFGVEIKPHLVHEAVRAEMNGHRAGTFASKSRGMVSGGRSKPWRQKGTGRARAGTVRAGQFTGGGHIFAKSPRSFDLKINRKAQRAALRSGLAAHAGEGSLALINADLFAAPSTKAAAALVAASGLKAPIVVVCLDEESTVAKSFRNLPKTAVVSPSELEVAAVVWARSLVVTEAALPLVETRAK